MAGKQIINVVQFWKASKIVSSPLHVKGMMLIDSWSVLISLRGKQPGRPPPRRSVDSEADADVK